MWFVLCGWFHGQSKDADGSCKRSKSNSDEASAPPTKSDLDSLSTVSNEKHLQAWKVPEETVIATILARS